MRNELALIRNEINLAALPGQAGRVFELVEMLSRGSLHYKEIQTHFGIAKGSVYRITALANDLLWNNEIRSKNGIFSIQALRNEL